MHDTPPPAPPIMPTAAEAQAAATGEPAPRTVQYGLGLLLASGALCLVASLLALLFRQQQIDYQIRHPPVAGLTPDDIRKNVTIQATLLIVAAVVNGAFIWLFGTKVRVGERRARIRLTVTVVLLGLFQVFFGSAISSLGVLLGIIGLILLYLPRAREFFAAEK